jgi:hypothetical protein
MNGDKIPNQMFGFHNSRKLTLEFNRYKNFIRVGYFHDS